MRRTSDLSGLERAKVPTIAHSWVPHLFFILSIPPELLQLAPTLKSLTFLNVLFPSAILIYKVSEANTWSSELFNIKIFQMEN